MASIRPGSTVVMAVDTETSGGRIEHDILAIGASVVDENLQKIDSLFLPCYFGKKKTNWELRCWDEFWNHHKDILKQLKYKGSLKKEERYKEVIELLQAFRAEWEIKAQDFNFNLEFVSDNNIFDGGVVNRLINKYVPDTLPLPYSSHSFAKIESDDFDDTAGINSYEQLYKPFWETHAEQRGLLMAIDPTFKGNWGLSARIEELYDIPANNDALHDHKPDNDAYVIAREQQILLGIRDGKFRLKHTPPNWVETTYLLGMTAVSLYIIYKLAKK